MSNITIVEVQGQLLIDSRIIAEQLGVEHSNFVELICKYQIEMEQAFGNLRFEKGTSKPNKNGAVHEIKFILLTEDQATFTLTLSRNTPQVVKCKIGLVKAFSHQKAKLAELNTTIPFQKALPTRAEIRQSVIAKESEIFSTYCHGRGLPVCKIHDYITVHFTGMTATQLRELGWVEGNANVGLNHVVSIEKLLLISNAKLNFARIKRLTGVSETWRQRADRSILKASQQ